MDLDAYRHRSSTGRRRYADGFASEENPGMTLEQRLDFMKAMALRGMPETLANLKREAESSPSSA